MYVCKVCTVYTTFVSDWFVWYHFAGGLSGPFSPVEAGHFFWHGSQLLPLLCKSLREIWILKTPNSDTKNSKQPIAQIWIACLSEWEVDLRDQDKQIGTPTFPEVSSEASSYACRGLDAAPGSACTSSSVSSGSDHVLVALCTGCLHGPWWTLMKLCIWFRQNSYCWRNQMTE